MQGKLDRARKPASGAARPQRAVHDDTVRVQTDRTYGACAGGAEDELRARGDRDQPKLLRDGLLRGGEAAVGRRRDGEGGGVLYSSGVG